MERIYVGVRTDQGCKVLVWDGLVFTPLSPCLHVRSHSPTGFEWGYCGSGPAQLALALCVDILGKAGKTDAVYHEVMRHVLTQLPSGCWSMSATTLRDMVEWCRESMQHDRMDRVEAARKRPRPDGTEGGD